MSIIKISGREKIAKLNKKIRLYKGKSKNNAHPLIKNKFILPAVLLIIILAMLVFLRPVFIGYFALEEAEEHVKEVDKLFVEDSSYLFSLEEGELKSLKLNGQLIGDGSAKVYLEAGNESYLVFDSTALEEEGIIGITGLAVGEFNETQNETVAENESIELNETLDLNETIPANETLVLNETLNKTILMNETVQINETLENITNPPEDAEILIELEYNDGTEFDIDNNGIETRDGIIDFNVNAEFNWAVDENNLCTKWETKSLDNETSVTVCYGNERCCNFIGLEPLTSNWNEVFYSYYGRYGTTSKNKISAQVVYVDYRISEENPYSYVYYSDWASLNAIFLEEEEKITEFDGICIETCLLSLNETFYRLRIELENATLRLDNISYTIIPLKVEIINNAPELLINISDITIAKNGEFSIDLSKYFFDKDNDSLDYIVYEMDDIPVLIDGNVATFMPKKGFTGIRHSFFIANDSRAIAISNVFKVNVTKALIVENVTILNISETPTQLKAEINKPVKWVKKVKAENNETIAKSVNVSFSILKKAFNLAVKDIKLDRLIDKNKIAVKPDKDELKEDETKEKELEFEDSFEANEAKEYIVEYETEAPIAVEIEISDYKKQIIISSDVHYENILAYTSINESYPELINLYWLVNDSRELVSDISYIDTNNNGLIDRLEWIVPSLSNQTYELIVEISKAEHLDENHSFISDIYDKVKAQDGIWSEPIYNNEYIRVVFKSELSPSRDITVYARNNQSLNTSIEVYYYNSTEKITEFPIITDEKYYKIYLTNMSGSHDTFDLKIKNLDNNINAYLEFDHIIDPDPPTDCEYCVWIVSAEDFVYRVRSGNLRASPSLESWDTLYDYPSGIEYYDGWVYVVGPDDNGYMWKFYQDGTEAESWYLGDFAQDPFGLCANETHFFIVDKINDEVYVNPITNPGKNPPDITFSTDADSEGCFWKEDENIVYVTSSNQDRVVLYEIDGTANGTIYNLHGDIGSSTGIVWNDTHWLISDDSADVIFVLTHAELAAGSYTYKSDDTSSDPQGLAYFFVDNPPVDNNISINVSGIFALADIEHRVRWTDEVGLSYYYFEWNATGAGCDEGFSNATGGVITGINTWKKVTRTVPSACIGKIIGWKQHVNDTINQWHSSDMQTYYVHGDEPFITANVTSPELVYQDTDWSLSLTIFDGNDSTVTGYVQFYVNNVATGVVQSQVVSSNSNALIGTLSSSNFDVDYNLTAEFWAGDGTENTSKYNTTQVTVGDSPYNITNCTKLQNMNNDLTGDYTLSNNINCSDTINWNGGEGFKPIGNNSPTTYRFSGTLDGQEYKITGLYINRQSTNYQGLFGYTTSAASINNVILENVDITALGRVGSIAGSNQGGISNSYASGDIIGFDANLGGLVGSTSGTNGDISNCHFIGSVTGGSESDHVGGLVGWQSSGGTISNCYSISNVSSSFSDVGGSVGGLVGISQYYISFSHSISNIDAPQATQVGGLVGWSDRTISDCYAYGNVIGKSMVGGLVGRNQDKIYRSYSISNVTGSSNSVGGLVGRNYAAGSGVYYSYALGNVDGSGSAMGGLVGENGGTISESYSISNVTGSSYYIGGFVGYNRYGDILNSYAGCNVYTGGGTGQYHGGFGGYNSLGTINKSYSTCYVESVNESSGGFVGRVNIESSGYSDANNFWDNQTSGKNTTIGNATGKTTVQMKNITNYNDTSTEGLNELWDIVLYDNYVDETWYIDDGSDYPRLGWEYIPPANTAPTITANATKPDPVYMDTDLMLNLTITDPNEGDNLTAYTQFYINRIASGSVHNLNITNGTNTNVANLSNLDFGKGDTLIAEFWAGDGTDNSTKENTTEITVLSYGPVIIANITKPDTVYMDTDWMLNLTITDPDDGDNLTAYTQFYVNGSSSGLVHSLNVTNGTNTNVANLSSSDFGKGATLIAEFWAGDGTENTTKENTTEVTVQNSVPLQPSLTSPANNSYINSINMTWTASFDAEGDTVYYHVLVNGTQACYTDYLNCSYDPSEGYYQWNVTPYDETENGTTSDSWYYTYDTTQPVLNFTLPTEANETTVDRNWTEANMTIDEPHLDTFKFSWNNTDYTFYNDLLVLALNFNNNSAIGENSTYLVDISSYGNDGTAESGAHPITSGKFSGAYEFDGSNDYVNVSDSASLNLTVLSIGFWFKPEEEYNSSTDYISFVYHDDYEIFIDNGSMIFNYKNNNISSSTTSWNKDQWYHVFATYDGSTQALYVNGLIESSASVSLFTVKNSDGENTASFLGSGDIVLKGSCSAGSCSYPGDDAFIIQNSLGETVAYINSTGDLCIEDSNCNYNDASCSNPGDGSFILKDSDDVIISYINATGHLCLIGELTEDWSP